MIDLRLRRQGSAFLLNVLLQFRNAFQGGVPTRFEFPRDVSLGWINQLVSSCGT